MGRRQRVADLDGGAQELGGRHRTLLQPPGQRVALDELHDEVVGPFVAAHVVQRADVRMREARHRARLPLEPFAQIGAVGCPGGQHFDRDIPVEPRVARAVDLPHAARAERREDLVGTETGAGLQSHRMRGLVAAYCILTRP
jgi:hypothetical protein